VSEAGEQMDVVFQAADEERRAIELFEDAAPVRASQPSALGRSRDGLN